MESNQNSDTLRLKALELMGKLPRLIDNIQDEETSLELGQFLKCLANFVAMLEGEQDAYPHLTPERHDEQAAIADNAEYEEAEDAAPDPQACSEVDDDPTTDPPLIDDDPDTDPPMLDDDPDTDIDDAFVSEEEDEAEVGDTISEDKRRRSGRPMIKLFTLNDRYRFRRELFGNLDAAMAEALDTLSMMDDIGQARAYLEDDLCWDMTLPEVEEFVVAITPYYSSSRS